MKFPDSVLFEKVSRIWPQ